jgi:predicted short-subunit dehydrogenase-like oxidoreductase (DUF2520 family)
MNVTILGAGKVGRALSSAIRARGGHVVLRSRGRGMPRAAIATPLLVIATRDRDILPVARELARARKVSRSTAVVHVAGALDESVLAPLRGVAAGIGQAHPLVAFAASGFAPRLEGAQLLVSGDRVAVLRARRLARFLGMTPRAWPEAERPLYHAAAGLVANGAAALAAAGEVLLVRGGAPARDVRKALGPLLRSVAENVLRLGTPDALTGPVRRGDAETVERHLAAIRATAPELLGLYGAAVTAQIPLARALGEAAPGALARIARVVAAPRRGAPRKERRQA